MATRALPSIWELVNYSEQASSQPEHGSRSEQPLPQSSTSQTDELKPKSKKEGNSPLPSDSHPSSNNLARKETPNGFPYPSFPPFSPPFPICHPYIVPTLKSPYELPWLNPSFPAPVHLGNFLGLNFPFVVVGAPEKEEEKDRDGERDVNHGFSPRKRTSLAQPPSSLPKKIRLAPKVPSQENIKEEEPSRPEETKSDLEQRLGYTVEELEKLLKPYSTLNVKPPYSYATLIEFGIACSPQQRLTLKEIYEWIQLTFKFYRDSDKNWKNAIRHTLSLQECFAKLPRSGFGKGNYWIFLPGENSRRRFIKKVPEPRSLSPSHEEEPTSDRSPSSEKADFTSEETRDRKPALVFEAVNFVTKEV